MRTIATVTQKDRCVGCMSCMSVCPVGAIERQVEIRGG